MEGILKGTEKGTGAAKAGIQCNLCHGELCGQQKVSGIIKPSGIHIIGKSGVELFRKYPGEDKTADTEFFRETVQGQFLRVVGIQIEKQPLLQLQILRAFPGMQGEGGQEICQKERQIPFRIDLHIRRSGTIFFHGGSQTLESP